MIRSTFASFSCAVLAAILLFAGKTHAQTYDFEDGTLQGWTKGDPVGTGFTGGLYTVATGGNPGVYMQAEDLVAGGGILAALAPAGLTGNLSWLESVSWDEFLPSGAVISSVISILSTDGSYYRSDLTIVLPRGQWASRSVSFTSSVGWSLLIGTTDFETAMSSVAALHLELSVSGSLGLEAAVDNINFIAKPGAPIESSTMGAVKSHYQE